MSERISELNGYLMGLLQRILASLFFKIHIDMSVILLRGCTLKLYHVFICIIWSDDDFYSEPFYLIKGFKLYELVEAGKKVTTNEKLLNYFCFENTFINCISGIRCEVQVTRDTTISSFLS